MNIKNTKIAISIAKLLKFYNYKNFLFITVYLIITLMNALLEGVGLIIVVDIFTGKGSSDQFNSDLLIFIENNLSIFNLQFNLNLILGLICALFFLRIICFGTLSVADGYAQAIIRKSIQTMLFKNYIQGQWKDIRNVRAGHAVNIMSTEAMSLTKYYYSWLKLAYFFLTSVFLLLVAMLVDYKITLTLGLITIPFLAILYYLLKAQTKLSESFAIQRNNFGADISERLSGAMQIQAESSQNFHIKSGLRTQPSMKRLEILIGYCQAAISIFSIILPLVIFLIILLISIFYNFDINIFLTSLATIGIIGVRTISQINGLIGMIGNISRFEGSLIVINKTLEIEKYKEKENIDNVEKIKCTNLSYVFNGKKIIDNLNFEIEKNQIFILQGTSGSGKTTIANLISGIMSPSSGSINYISNGKSYDSITYGASIGYVMQEIHLFKGSIRENLINDKNISDNEIWAALVKVEADQFVKKIGGLESEILEAGRSLSGGQVRRLGIARILLMNADIIILDEITSGLDRENSISIKKLILELSKNRLVILISHDQISFDNSAILKL